jgi:capsular exopolysaccharide synthesis family protein
MKKLVTQYVASNDSLANALFGTVADNTFWNSFENKNDKVYLVTSATKQEGKTTIAANLAIKLARRGKDVLLIDGNLRNPMLGEIFNVNGSAGFSDILSNDTPIQDIILPIEKFGIYLTPPGKNGFKPMEVLTSTKTKAFFGIAKIHFDYVIVDSSAVNCFPDPLLLCNAVDKVILVVLSDKTEKSEVVLAKTKITDARANIMGVVLNKSSTLFIDTDYQ